MEIVDSFPMKDIIEHVRLALERQQVENRRVEEEAARAQQETQELQDRRVEVQQQFVNEIDAIDADSANLTAQLEHKKSELTEKINALKAVLDACTKQLSQLPNDVLQKKQDAEQRKEQKTTAIDDELQAKEYDRRLLSAKLAAKKQKETEEIKIMQNILGSSAVSSSTLNYPTPASSPSENPVLTEERHGSQQATVLASSPPLETINTLIQLPPTPLDSIEDELAVQPTELASSYKTEEVRITTECQPILGPTLGLNSSGKSPELEYHSSDPLPKSCQYERNRRMLWKDVQEHQVPLEYNGKLYIMDCPVCHRSEFKTKHLSLAVFKHLSQTHQGTFNLKARGLIRPGQIALEWCTILIEDATVEQIQSLEADDHDLLPLLESGNSGPADGSEELADDENLEDDLHQSVSSRAENSSRTPSAVSLVMDASKFIVRDGIYVSPPCMAGVPVSMIKEDDEYWHEKWDTVDTLIQMAYRPENEHKRHIEDIKRSLELGREGLPASRPVTLQLLKTVKRRLYCAESVRKRTEKAVRSMQQYPFHLNQFLSKKYVTGRGFMVPLNVVSFERIFAKLENSIIDQEPLQWLRGRFAVIIEQYESRGREAPIKSLLANFENVDPAICALKSHWDDEQSEDEDEDVDEDEDEDNENDDEDEDEDEDKEDERSTINVAQSATSAILETTEHTNDDEYGCFQKLNADRKRKGTDSSLVSARPEKIRRCDQESYPADDEGGDACLEEPRNATQSITMNSKEPLRSESRSTAPDRATRDPSFKLRSVDFGDIYRTSKQNVIDIRLSYSYLRLNVDGTRYLKLLLRDILIFCRPKCKYSILRYSRVDQDEISLYRDGKEKISMTFENNDDREKFIYLLEERNPGLAGNDEGGFESQSENDLDEEDADTISHDNDADEAEDTCKSHKNSVSDEEDEDETATNSSDEDEDVESTNPKQCSNIDPLPCSVTEQWFDTPPLLW